MFHQSPCRRVCVLLFCLTLMKEHNSIEKHVFSSRLQRCGIVPVHRKINEVNYEFQNGQNTNNCKNIQRSSVNRTLTGEKSPQLQTQILSISSAEIQHSEDIFSFVVNGEHNSNTLKYLPENVILDVSTECVQRLNMCRYRAGNWKLRTAVIFCSCQTHIKENDTFAHFKKYCQGPTICVYRVFLYSV